MTHIIQTRLSIAKNENNIDDKLCQVCRIELGVKFCPKCDLTLCEECDLDVHEGGHNDEGLGMN